METGTYIRRVTIAAMLAFPVSGNAQNDSLSLQQAVAIALAKNYDITIEEKTLSIDSMNNTWGSTGALPTVGLNGTVSEKWTMGGDPDYKSQSESATVDLNWTVFRGFAARIQKKQLDEYEKMSENNLGIAVENTIVDVTLAYYNTLLSEEKVQLAEEVMNLSEDRYLREQRKKDMGVSYTYDMLLAKNAWLEDKSSYLSAQSAYRNALRQLNYLMANNEPRGYALVSEFVADTNKFAYNVLEGKLLSNNKTMQNQYTNLMLSKLSIKAAQSAYYPTLSVGASTGYSGSNTKYADSPNLDQDVSAFGVTTSAALSYTIYNGGERLRSLKEAQISELISQVKTEQMERELKNQLAQEFELYELRKALLEVAKENEQAAKLNLEISEKKFSSGAINSFDYRTVQQTYANSALNVLTATYNTIESYNTLLRMTGGVIDE